MVDLPANVREVRLLRLLPGDIIVAKVDENIRPQEAERARERLMRAFPDHEVLVLAGADLEVVRPEHSDGDAGV